MTGNRNRLALRSSRRHNKVFKHEFEAFFLSMRVSIEYNPDVIRYQIRDLSA